MSIHLCRGCVLSGSTLSRVDVPGRFCACGGLQTDGEASTEPVRFACACMLPPSQPTCTYWLMLPQAEPDSDDSDDDGSSKLTKRQKQAADYKRMQEAEGEKIMAELKRKKERDALEEEVRVIERQLKTTVRPALALSSFVRSMSTCQLTSVKRDMLLISIMVDSWLLTLGIISAVLLVLAGAEGDGAACSATDGGGQAQARG